MLLDGKRAIITGGARGTGATIARRFVEEGARVVIGDVREDEGRAVAGELGEAARFARLDVANEESWRQLVDGCLAAEGRIDVLVNNAAVLHMGNIENTSLDDFRRQLEVNTLGAFAGIRAVVPSMKRKGGGAIVNVASLDGLIGMNGVSAYAASKWGLRGLTKATALELSRDGIRVNAVCPAGGNGQMFAPWGDQLAAMEDQTRAYVADRAIPREATLVEIADAVVFLASDRSSFCAGVDLPVDGGHTSGSFVAGFNRF